MPDVDAFRAQAREFGFNEEEYLEALALVPVISEDRLPSIAGFLTTYAEIVANMAGEYARRLNTEQRLSRAAEEILEIATPMLRLLDGVLAVPLIGMLDTERTYQFMEALLAGIAANQTEVVLLDITGVPSIDTQTAQHLMEAVSAARLLGSDVVITGIRPSIAQTLVHLGIDLTGITTRASLAAGLEVAMRLRGLSLTGAE